MEEIFPVASGILFGLVTYRSPRWLETIVLSVLSVVVGAFAAWASGELSLSWGYVIIDAAQIAAAAVMTGYFVKAWLRHRARSVVR